MLKLRRIDIERSAEIFEKIERYKDRLVEVLRPETVVLFGSFARNDVHEGSDVDILVIADFKEPFLDRIKLLLDLNERERLPLEAVGYTPMEFQKMQEEGNRFILEVLERSKVLHGILPKKVQAR